MLELTISEIAAAIGARYQGPDCSIDHISTDSRDLAGNCLFVALEGEQVDGHKFIQSALDAGAAFAVAHRPVENDRGRVLYVKDTFLVLMDIARHYRERFSLVTVGVTGSVGKTTTKEFIAAVLSKKYRTLKSEGNHNNEIGLPKTIFSLDQSHQAAILEMGMSALGDIRLLTGIVRPDVGVITNIGVAHLEKLGSRENILKAKMELTEGMPDGAPLVLNGDDDLLCKVREHRLKPLYYGVENPDCSICATDIVEGEHGTRFLIHWDGQCHQATLPTIGRHNVYNALAAFAVGVCLDIATADILEALQSYLPAGMRQRMVEYNGFTVVEDCYNASPDSMRAALETLREAPVRGRRICVFADMLELGEISEEAHIRVGELAAQSGVNLLLCYGPAAMGYVQGARAGGLKNAQHCRSKEELAAKLCAELRAGDMVWVKGSRGMQLEDLLEKIYRA